jgi:hypothetical protein
MYKLPLAVLLFVVGCIPSQDIETPRPQPPDNEPGQCEIMCEHLVSLGCEEGKPVYNNDLPGPADVPNQSCPDFCEDLQGKGVPVNPQCVALIEICDQVEEYRTRDSASCVR